MICTIFDKLKTITWESRLLRGVIYQIFFIIWFDEGRLIVDHTAFLKTGEIRSK
jgi:hypothetical protein